MSAEATLEVPSSLSINTAAFADCSTYMTSDGQSYVPLVISMGALQKVLSGERAVTDATPRLRRGRSSHRNPSLEKYNARLVACGQGNGHISICCVFI